MSAAATTLDDRHDAFQERVLSLAVWIAAVAAVVQVTIHLLNGWAWSYVGLLDVNWEDGRPGPWVWASVAATFAAGYTALVAAIGGKRPALRWWGLAAVLVFFSFDDATLFHERLAFQVLKALGLSFEWDSVIWPILYLPLGGFVAYSLFRIAQEAGPRIRRFILVGLGMLIAAVVAEVVSAPWSGEDGGGQVHKWEGALEETLELVAWILIAAALVAAVLRPKPDVRAV